MKRKTSSLDLLETIRNCSEAEALLEAVELVAREAAQRDWSSVDYEHNETAVSRMLARDMRRIETLAASMRSKYQAQYTDAWELLATRV